MLMNQQKAGAFLGALRIGDVAFDAVLLFFQTARDDHLFIVCLLASQNRFAVRSMADSYDFL